MTRSGRSKRALPEPDKCWCLSATAMEGFQDYHSSVDMADTVPAFPDRARRDTLAIFYTSGTTGLPKGALVSHENLVMNGYNQIIADKADGNDINLIATPVYHMGAVFMAVTYMMLGCTQHMSSENLTPARGWDCLNRAVPAWHCWSRP